MLEGRAGMPAVGAMMDDGQVADVVAFARARFGGFKDDPLSAAAVKALREEGKKP